MSTYTAEVCEAYSDYGKGMLRFGQSYLIPQQLLGLFCRIVHDIGHPGVRGTLECIKRTGWDNLSVRTTAEAIVSSCLWLLMAKPKKDICIVKSPL